MKDVHECQDHFLLCMAHGWCQRSPPWYVYPISKNWINFNTITWAIYFYLHLGVLSSWQKYCGWTRNRFDCRYWHFVVIGVKWFTFVELPLLLTSNIWYLKAIFLNSQTFALFKSIMRMAPLFSPKIMVEPALSKSKQLIFACKSKKS